MSVKYWTESSTNRNCRRCRYPPMKCTAWNRYCSAARRTEALVKWYPSTVARLSSFHSNDDRRVDNRSSLPPSYKKKRKNRTQKTVLPRRATPPELLHIFSVPCVPKRRSSFCAISLSCIRSSWSVSTT